MEYKNDEREHHRKHVVDQNCIAYNDKRLMDFRNFLILTFNTVHKYINIWKY